MTDQQRAARLAQALRELSELADEIQEKADYLHEWGGWGEWPHDLDIYAHRLSSTRDYLRELEP